MVSVALEDYSDAVTVMSQSRLTAYVGLIGFMILVWDHMITFEDEVRYVWQGRKSALVVLFLINRYLTPLGFIVNLIAYLSSTWTVPMCQRFVRYEGSMTVVGINIVALMMLLRIYALYSGQRLIPMSVVSFVLLVELAVNIWLVTQGEAVPSQTIIHSCSMVFDPSVHRIASASAYLPLIYDTIVFVLTLNRTWKPFRFTKLHTSNKDEIGNIGLGLRNASSVARTVVQDGVIYYSVIFSVTLVLTVMIAAAPQGIQNIAAQLELLLTVAMMSRITLNLKRQGRRIEVGPSPTPNSSISLKSVTFRLSRSQIDRIRTDVEEAFRYEGDEALNLSEPPISAFTEDSVDSQSPLHLDPHQADDAEIAVPISAIPKRPRTLRFLSFLEEEEDMPLEEEIRREERSRSSTPGPSIR